jgi:hypothetical protein
VDEISVGWLMVMKDEASLDKNQPDLFCVPEQTELFLRRIDEDVSTRKSVCPPLTSPLTSAGTAF